MSQVLEASKITAFGAYSNEFESETENKSLKLFY